MAGILRRIVRGRTPIDKVFHSCRKGEPSADSWAMPNQSGIRVAAWLQFHTSDDVLPADTARLRIAYRNFYPQTFEFERSVSVSGGEIGPYTSTAIPVSAVGEDSVKRDGLVPGGIPVTRHVDDDAEVRVELQFTQPDSLNHLKGDLDVVLTAAPRHRCSCCWQLFPS